MNERKISKTRVFRYNSYLKTHVFKLNHAICLLLPLILLLQQLLPSTAGFRTYPGACSTAAAAASGGAVCSDGDAAASAAESAASAAATSAVLYSGRL